MIDFNTLRRAILFGVIAWGFSHHAYGQSYQMNLQSTIQSCDMTCTLQVYRLTGVCPPPGNTSLRGFVLKTGNLSPLVTGTSTLWTYADKSLTVGTTYCWCVTAKTATGTTAPSVWIQGTIVATSPLTVLQITG